MDGKSDGDTGKEKTIVQNVTCFLLLINILYIINYAIKLPMGVNCICMKYIYICFFRKKNTLDLTKLLFYFCILFRASFSFHNGI